MSKAQPVVSSSSARAGTGRLVECQALLLPRGWQSPAFVYLDAEGKISSISASLGDADTPDEIIKGWVIPGLVNGHSHAFQYAMAGLAEALPPGTVRDDFWSWRQRMYALARNLSPEQCEAIAAMAYAEMVRFGLTAVTEFHYLHHDPHGKPYADVAVMGERLMAAAATAGIHLTLVPVHYRLADFGTPARPEQVRFISQTLADYERLLAATQVVAKKHEDVIVGRGIHSLRAVAAAETVALFSTPFPGPNHLHIAEQQREVEACQKHLGARPVQWLLDHVPVDQSYALVHATHADASELRCLAQTKATAVLCPSTEANLADGLFGLETFREAGGLFAIGTDSHVSLDPFAELRWLDYGQRLVTHQRASFCHRPSDDSGELGFSMAWAQGRRVAGLVAGNYFAVGQTFDAVVIDPEHPVMIGKPPARRLSALIYGGDPTCLMGTIRRGKWLVRRQRHANFAAIYRAYSQTLAGL